MPHQGEMELLRRVRAHTFIIEGTSSDVVNVTFLPARGGAEGSYKFSRLQQSHDGQDHDTEYVFDAHNRAHAIKDEKVRAERIEKTELELPKAIPLEHQPTKA